MQQKLKHIIWKGLRMLTIYDLWLITTTILMLFASILLIASAGSAVAISHNWNIFFFIKKHLAFCFLSICLLLYCTLMPDNKITKFGQNILLIGIIGVICTFFIGTQIKGAYRWLNILGFSLQPSEIMKVGCIMTCSNLISNKEHKLAMCIFIFCAFLLIMQPDFGSLILLSSILLLMAFVNGLRLIYFGGAIVSICLTALISFLTLPHVFKRVEIFFNKTEDKFGSHYQIIKATNAFKSGGFFGKGPGEGSLKYFLPDAHADFIFAVVGEEFGLIGTVCILSFYFIFLCRIFIHTLSNISDQTRLLIVGLGGHILLQSWLNVMSNLAIIPTKGFTLPIIGYGGSGLMMNMCAIGLLLNLTKKTIHARVLNKFSQ